MRRSVPLPLSALIVVTLLLAHLPPAAAQGEECPEGLVYDAAGDICVLPENLPPQEEAPPDEEPPAEEPVDEGELPVDESPTEAPVDDGEPAAEDQPAIDDAPAIAGDPAGTIRNLTLLTFACPINWNPATRDIEASREMCTEPIVPDITYTVLYDGVEQMTVPFRTDLDLVESAIPLSTSMWTIQESPAEGLDDPFAFCAIYAADGSSRLTVEETVPGGSLDILLAAGEEVNCEWYSVATVPETTGDPNALPIGGLRLDGFSCPYGTGSSTREILAATCVEKGVAAIEYTASLGGAVVSTQVGATDTPGVDFQTGLDTRLLSGTWTLAATLPPEYDKSYIFCSITTEAGATTDLEPEMLFDFVELDLQLGDNGFCTWFNVEEEPRTGPSLGISLLLHTCPENFDREGGDYNTCTLPLQEPIGFDFIRAGQVMETGTAASSATELRFTANDGKPEAGEWTIRPNVAADRIEPGWACWGVDSAGAKVLGIDYFSPTDGGNGISAKFGPNLMLQCDVWLYAGDLDDFVAVTAATCPAGFDAANPAAGDRNAACAKDRFVGFTYLVDDVAAGQGETSSNGLAITPKQPGQWRITAAPDAGFGLTFVTCDQTLAALNQIQTIEPTINADKLSITLDLAEGDSLRCGFFFGPMTAAMEAPAPAETEAGTGDPDTGAGEPVTDPAPAPAPDAGTAAPESGAFGGGAPESEPETGGGQAVQVIDNATDAGEAATGVETSSLAIQHWDCPNLIVLDAVMDELAEVCSVSLEPSAWQLNGEPLDAGDGYAAWDGLEPGTMRVGNLAVANKVDTASAVYCSVAPVDGEPLALLRVPVNAGAIDLVIDRPAVVYCDWFAGP